MDDIIQVLTFMLLLACLSGAVFFFLHQERLNQHQHARRQRRFWTRPWIGRRMDYGLFEKLMIELEREDLPGYRNFLRVYPDVFQDLLVKIAPRITRKNTNMRLAIPADLRLALTLRFLATGDSYMSHQYSFRVASNTIGQIIPDTCKALYEVLKTDFLSFPQQPEEWQHIANEFWKKWQFPNTIGALDGKHVVLRKPLNSGSTFYNYKGHFSIVLMAMADADYKFTYINIGTQGRISDGGVFAHCSLQRAINNKTINLPDPNPLPGDNIPMPYFMVADEAFPLRSYIMKPYACRNLTHEQRVYNYRICRARRIIENSFGILASRFGVFLKPMLLSPDRAELVVLACCALHNMLRSKYPTHVINDVDVEDPVTHNIRPGAWRGPDAMQNLQAMRGNNATIAAKAQRDYLCKYVNSPIGRVEWQDRVV